MAGESPPAAISSAHRFSHEAMATTFEIMIAGTDARYAGQAARAAFELIDRLEEELSRYLPTSDISRINNHTGDVPLKIGAAAFECLELSVRIHAETDGAFDVTVGALVDRWRSGGKTPSAEELERIRSRTGMGLLELDRARHTVRIRRPGVHVDLGGIGKGYAVDKAADLLQDWTSAPLLIHGGRSTALARGAPPGKPGWPVKLPSPGDPAHVLAHLNLVGGALSGSALKHGRPIIDPRSARPVAGTLAAWSRAPAAARADALSTAFMVMAPEDIKRFCAAHPEAGALIVTTSQRGKERVLRFGRLAEDS